MLAEHDPKCPISDRTNAGTSPVLCHAERGRPVRADPHSSPSIYAFPIASFFRAAAIGGILVGPIEAGSGQQPYLAVLDPCVNAVSIKLDFMKPVGTVRGLLHQFGELR